MSSAGPNIRAWYGARCRLIGRPLPCCSATKPPFAELVDFARRFCAFGMIEAINLIITRRSKNAIGQIPTRAGILECKPNPTVGVGTRKTR